MSGIVLWIVAAAALVLAIAGIVLLVLRKPPTGLKPGPTGTQGELGPTGPRGERGPTGPTGEPGQSEQSPAPVWQSMLLVYKNYLDEKGQDPNGAQIVPQRSILVDNTGPYFAAGSLTDQILDNGWWLQTQPLVCKQAGRYLFTGALFVVFPFGRGGTPPKDRYTLAIRWTPSGTRKGSPDFDLIVRLVGNDVGNTQTQLIPTFAVDMGLDDTLLVELQTLWNASNSVGAAVLLDIIPGSE